MSSIVIYFSRPGSNWVKDCVSNLEIGNCEILAKYIQQQTKSEIFRIETKRQYTNNYHIATQEAKKEKEANIYPELVSYPDNIDMYNKIYLVYPIWWETCPMAVFSLLKNYDFSNKTIIPLCTHEGSGISDSINDIKKYAKNAIVKNGYEVRGYKCQNLDKNNELQREICNFLEKTDKDR